MNKIFLSILLVSLIFIYPVSALSFGEAFNNIIKNPFSKLFSNTEMTGESIKDISGMVLKNIAKGKTCTSGSNHFSFVCEKALDGSSTTVWIPNYVDNNIENDWIEINVNENDVQQVIVYGKNCGTLAGNIYIDSNTPYANFNFIGQNSKLITFSTPRTVNKIKVKITSATHTGCMATTTDAAFAGITEITVSKDVITKEGSTCVAGSEYYYKSGGGQVYYYPCTNVFDNNINTDWATLGNLNPVVEITFPNREAARINYITIRDRSNIQDWSKKIRVYYYKYPNPIHLGVFELSLPNDGSEAKKYFDVPINIDRIQIEITDYNPGNTGLSEVDWGFDPNYRLAPLSIQPLIPPSTPTLIPSGCPHPTITGKYLPFGIRIKVGQQHKYCKLDETLQLQLEDNSATECQNDYECKSNLCSSGKCKSITEYENSLSLIKQIFCKLNPTATECRIGFVSIPIPIPVSIPITSGTD